MLNNREFSESRNNCGTIFWKIPILRKCGPEIGKRKFSDFFKFYLLTENSKNWNVCS